jgi:hypothetical protein
MKEGGMAILYPKGDGSIRLDITGKLPMEHWSTVFGWLHERALGDDLIEWQGTLWRVISMEHGESPDLAPHMSVVLFPWSNYNHVDARVKRWTPPVEMVPVLPHQ